MRGILIASVLAGAGGVAAAQPTSVTTTTTTTTTVTFDAPVATPAETPTVAAPVREAPADRTFKLSVAAGAGHGFDTKDHCEEMCGGVDVEIGGAIRPRLLVVAGVDAIAGEDGKDELHHAETLSLQWWARDRVWLQGGAGVGSPRNDQDGVMRPPLVPAMTAAIGYEAIATAHHSVGAQLRFASAIDDLHHASYLALLVGATFN